MSNLSKIQIRSPRRGRDRGRLEPDVPNSLRVADPVVDPAGYQIGRPAWILVDHLAPPIRVQDLDGISLTAKDHLQL